MSPFVVPLAVFAAVALIVAITTMTNIRDKELEVHQRLYMEEMDHRRKMQELENQLEAIRKESQ